MSSVLMPSGHTKNWKMGNSNNFQPDISPDLSGERHLTFSFSTELLLCYRRQKSINFKNHENLSRRVNLTINKMKINKNKMFKYKNLLSAPFELLNLFKKLGWFRYALNFSMIKERKNM